MNMRRALGTCVFTILVLATPAVPAQQVIRPSEDVLQAATMAVPIDPANNVDPARRPGEIGSRTLEPLGLTREQLDTGRAAVYSASRLSDESGRLEVFVASVVQQGDRWVFWSEDLPKSVVRSAGEVQITFETERDTRYLVDFAVDSADQPFAVVSGAERATQTPMAGHLALIVSGTGGDHKVRVIPQGDQQYNARRFTLFEVTVTPIR